MANSPDFLEHLRDLLAPLGEVVFRPLFGGHGAYRDGVMFALVARDRFYLRVDDQTRGDFEAEGMEGFGRMPYFEVPPDAMEEPDALEPWAEGAVAASRRAARKKKGKSGAK